MLALLPRKPPGPTLLIATKDLRVLVIKGGFSAQNQEAAGVTWLFQATYSISFLLSLEVAVWVRSGWKGKIIVCLSHSLNVVFWCRRFCGILKPPSDLPWKTSTHYRQVHPAFIPDKKNVVAFFSSPTVAAMPNVLCHLCFLKWKRVPNQATAIFDLTVQYSYEQKHGSTKILPH